MTNGTITAADELARAREVLEAHDAAGFARIALALGVALEYAPFTQYVSQHARRFVPGAGALGLKMIHAAMLAPHGYAYDQYLGSYTVIAVKDGDRVVLGACRANKSQPFKCWVMKPRWYKDPARNGPTVANWIADPSRAMDALSIPIVRAPVAAPSAPGMDDRGAALLAAVIANPEDVGARLVYGDWLVERGDVRGELIRVQCDLAGPLDEERRAALEQRETELLRAYRETIVAPVAPYVKRVEIARGLVESIEIHGDTLATKGVQLFGAHPITQLRMYVKDAQQFARLAKLPIYDKLVQLRIEGRRRKNVRSSSVALKVAAGATTMFANVRSLGFEDCDDTQTEWRKLFQTIRAPRLEKLDVQARLDEAATLALADSNGLPALTDLTIYEPMPKACTVAVAQRIAQRKALESVMIRHWPGTDDALAKYLTSLLAAPALVALRVFWCKGVGPLTLRAIGAHGAKLEKLSIYRCAAVNLGAIATLVASGKLAALRTLEIESLAGDDAACEALTRALCDAPPTLAAVTWHAATDEHGRATKAQAQRIVASGRSFRGRLQDD